jgi:hypothetical protein
MGESWMFWMTILVVIGIFLYTALDDHFEWSDRKGKDDEDK